MGDLVPLGDWRNVGLLSSAQGSLGTCGDELSATEWLCVAF